jgi:hypothetical protein
MEMPDATGLSTAPGATRSAPPPRSTAAVMSSPLADFIERVVIPALLHRVLDDDKRSTPAARCV